jgi:hypothetical protein
LGEHGWPYRTQPRPVDVLTVVDFDNPHTALRTGARVHHGVVNLMILQIYRDIYLDRSSPVFVSPCHFLSVLHARQNHPLLSRICIPICTYAYIPSPTLTFCELRAAWRRQRAGKRGDVVSVVVSWRKSTVDARDGKVRPCVRW